MPHLAKVTLARITKQGLACISSISYSESDTVPVCVSSAEKEPREVERGQLQQQSCDSGAKHTVERRHESSETEEEEEEDPCSR